MATITGNYNVTVESRYYAFLQDDMESAEPHVLMATVEKNRELRKENKTKAKKEKRNKQIAEQIKESIKIENIVEDVPKIETEIIENKQESLEKPIEISEPVNEDKQIENKVERSFRGRGNTRRPNGNTRRGGPPRNEDRNYNTDEGSQQKSQDNGYNRFTPNNRGRPFRKERPEGENFNKVDDEQLGSTNRGTSARRRPSGRGSARFNRGNDRNANDRTGNDRSTNDRNSNERTGNDRSLSDRNMNDRNGNEENLRTDIIPENMGTFEDMSIRPPRSNRGRFPRSNRGGFNRYSAPSQDNENDFDNRIGYFNENADNREYRGGRGRSRGGRSMRRGRGDFWRPRGNDREENPNDGFPNNYKSENRDVPVTEKWPCAEDELGLEPNNNEPSLNVNVVETDFNDVKKSNWGEIEDDPVELKTSNEHMTLEEWKALHGKDRLLNQEGKENRKANDGQDVFSGMEEYRKGRFIEEQGDEHDIHENQHGRQKQSIPVAIRFSRNTEYGDSNTFDQTSVDNRSFSRGYYKNENKFRGENSAGGRGRSRGSSDFNTYGRGRDFNRGRGRFSRIYPVMRKDDQVDGVNINLGNEDEFPTLS